MPGVFISKGMQVGIPKGGLTISMGEDGALSGELSLHVRFDVCPMWMSIALNHLKDAQGCQKERVKAWQGTDEAAKAATLEAECISSMQAIMSAAIAFDAFYSNTQIRVNIPPSLIATWRTKRTARYVQISETIRQGFVLSNTGFQVLRRNLKELYRLRDLAVHPTGKLDRPIAHPELDGVGVEWRFFYFRFEHAQLLVGATTKMLAELTGAVKTKNEEVAKYIATLTQQMEQLRARAVPLSTVAA